MNRNEPTSSTSDAVVLVNGDAADDADADDGAALNIFSVMISLLTSNGIE